MRRPGMSTVAAKQPGHAQELQPARLPRRTARRPMALIAGRDRRASPRSPPTSPSTACPCGGGDDRCRGASRSAAGLGRPGGRAARRWRPQPRAVAADPAAATAVAAGARRHRRRRAPTTAAPSPRPAPPPAPPVPPPTTRRTGTHRAAHARAPTAPARHRLGSGAASAAVERHRPGDRRHGRERRTVDRLARRAHRTGIAARSTTRVNGDLDDRSAASVGGLGCG